MNYHENFHPLNCGLFPTIFTKKLSDLLHSKWTVGELKQMIIITNQWSFEIKVDNLQQMLLMLPLLVM